MSSIFISINKSDTLEKSPIDKAITRIAAALARQRSLIPPGPGLEVSFLPASEDFQPDFTGMRMGGYHDDDPVLHFHVAIPAQFAHSPLALRYVVAALEDVLTNADDYFREQHIAFDRVGWQRVLNAAARTSEDPPESAWEEYPLS